MVSTDSTKTLSTLYEVLALASMYIILCWSAYALASSWDTSLWLSKSILFPTSVITILWFPSIFTSVSHLSMWMKLSLLEISKRSSAPIAPL
ncbi:unnamed protein product [Blepharisma stoltei]|uniref:NADH dehydrogenase subunit 5 n=1 Tax=Blepharisma stoltei TaxID=1481888 RepID=A0AAU9JKV1_9CILI|nr:unnamed protein product [Blepharisma stoltei]